MTESPNIVDVVAAIFIQDRTVLAARRGPHKSMAGFWELPGGKIESGEDPKDALVRELREEFSVGVSIGKYLGENLHQYERWKIRLMAYEVTHLEGEFKLTDHEEIRWLSRHQFDEVNWAPADIPFITRLAACWDSTPLSLSRS